MKRQMHVLRNRWQSGRVSCCITAISLVFAVAAESQADDRFWNSLFGGAFNAAANWQGGFIPGPGDVAHFGRTVNPNVMQAIYTVDFDVSPTNQALKIEDDFVTFDLNGRTYSTTAVSGNEIGNVAGTSGRLTITDGTLRVDNVASVKIGAGANATGFLTVTTGGRITSAIAQFPLLTIGSSGTGTLTVNNGGIVDANLFQLAVEATAGIPGTGTADITGTGSTLTVGVMDVGHSGSGTLNITAGAVVQSFFQAVEFNSMLGTAVGGIGAVTIDGADSRWVARNMVIGIEGQGTIEITDGGRLETITAILGHHAPGSGAVSVDGAASRWINANELTLGNDGEGTLNITAGAQVQNSDGFIGRNALGTGAVTVHGVSGVDGDEPFSQWVNSRGLTIGHNGSGSLSVEAGGRVTNTVGVIARFAGSEGTVTVDGPGSMWTNSGSIELGDGGDGSLTISNGGIVVSAGGELADLDVANAEVTVTGPGSAWNMNSGALIVGDDGTATVSILDGGAVSNTNATIGADTAAVGTVTVSGAGSTWTNSGILVVGLDGDGTLVIEDGGQVSSDFGFVADFEESTSTATVTGAGSSWTNGGFFAVGQFGDGTLTIADGGSVASAIGFIGTRLGSSGEVTVTGAGSSWATSGNFVVGFQGTVELSILNGGSVSSNNSWIAGATTSTATVSVTGAGSNWTIAGRLAIGEAFDPEELGPGGGTGTLTIQPGGTVSVAQEIALFPGATLSLEGGTLDTASVSFQGGGAFNFLSGKLHVGTFYGNLLNQAGTLAPGRAPPEAWSAGSTTIVGSYGQQAGARLEIEIGGTSPGSAYDDVDVTGIAGLSGQLQLAMIGIFMPSPNDRFTVFNAAAGIVGVFSNITTGQRLLTSDGTGSFLVHYGVGSAFDQNEIVLSEFEAIIALPGDYNRNGTVDAADYVLWRKNLGTMTMLPNDPIGGTIGPAQYNQWRANFGALAGSGSLSNATVPEPSTAWQLLLGSVVACWSGRRIVSRSVINLLTSEMVRPSTELEVARRESRNSRPCWRGESVLAADSARKIRQIDELCRLRQAIQRLG